jgi:Lrp/AsnC family transcriptional regulator for asnA, asnC and gidA
MNAKDLAILNELRRDARMTLLDIAHHTGIPLSTVHERMKRVQQELVTKNTMLVRLDRLGFPHRMLYAFTAKRLDFNELRSHPHLNGFTTIANGKDTLIEMVFRTVAEATLFEEWLTPRVANLRTVHLIEDLKREAWTPKDVRHAA